MKIVIELNTIEEVVALVALLREPLGEIQVLKDLTARLRVSAETLETANHAVPSPPQGVS